MQTFAKNSGFSASGAFAEDWLKGIWGWKSKWRAKNCGIIGGLQRRVWPFISAQAELTDTHWQAVQRRADVRALRRIRGPVEMLVLNQLLLDRNESHLSGFPSRPVNMPFMGTFATTSIAPIAQYVITSAFESSTKRWCDGITTARILADSGGWGCRMTRLFSHENGL